MNLKDLVKGNYCTLDRIRSKVAYYYIEDNNNITWEFNVPIEDMGDATFNAREKAIYLMRWIRKAMDNNELIFVSKDIPLEKTVTNRY